MNATDAQNEAPDSDRLKNASNRNARKGLQAISEYISKVLAASLITMWGALNLVISIRSALSESVDAVPEADPASSHGYITLLFVLFTAVLPFLIGLYLFRRLYQQTNVK